MKKISTLIFIIALIMSLAACGENNNSDISVVTSAPNEENNNSDVSDITSVSNEENFFNTLDEATSSYNITYDSGENNTSNKENIGTDKSNNIKPQTTDKNPNHFSSNQISDTSNITATKPYENNSSVAEAEKEPAKVLVSGKCGDNLTWQIDEEGLLKISGTGRMYNYCKGIYQDRTKAQLISVQKSQGYGGIDESKSYDPDGQYVAPWYKYRYEPSIPEYSSQEEYDKWNPNGITIKRIEVEDGVTYIGDWAFYRIGVKSLSLPETVVEMGEWCVRYSEVLESLNLPKSLKKIGYRGISRNYALTNITGGVNVQKIGEACFADNRVMVSVSLPSLKKAGNNIFEGCLELKSADIGSVDKIYNRMFVSCSSLESIIIPKEVISIEEYAFYNCTSLKSVTFESGSMCEKFLSTSFQNCSSLKSVIGGKNLKHVARFVNCCNLQNFEFSDSNETFEKVCFFDTKLQSAYIGSGIKSIPVGMFMKCSELEQLTISKNVESIGGTLLNSCSALKKINFSGSEEEWNNITKEPYWSNGAASDCVVEFCDGTQKMLSSVK